MRPNYHPNVLKIFTAILILVFVGSVHAGNWYVRPTSTGSSTGLDWNNAWSMSGISWGSVKAGDTVWLAGGTYNGTLAITASGTSSARIQVKRVVSSDSVPVAAAGWNSSFDSQVVINGATCIDIPYSSYITIDGRMNAGNLTSNTRVYGIKCVQPKSGGDIALWGDNNFSGSQVNVTDLSLLNIDFVGPYNTAATGANSTSNGLNFAPYAANNRTNILVHDCRFAGFCETIREASWHNSVIEYCYIGPDQPDGLDHEDVDLYYKGDNQIWRYNIINKSMNDSDGIAIGPDGYGTWSFYGNVYYGSHYWYIKLAGNVGPYHIYNNVFVSNSTDNGWVKLEPSQGGVARPGSDVYNNIFVNATNDTGGVTTDYNCYNYTNLNGFVPPTEAHDVNTTKSGSSDQTAIYTYFVNPNAGDFHLTAAGAVALAGGRTLTGDGFINKDMEGKTRGGPWYIGAYQYGSSQSAPTPLPPSNLRITGG